MLAKLKSFFSNACNAVGAAWRAFRGRDDEVTHTSSAPSPPEKELPRPESLRITDFLDFLSPEPDKYARRLELPQLPKGVPRCGSGMAFDDASGFSGSFPNQAFLGGGDAFTLFFPGYPKLALLAQRSEFRQPTETHAKDMTREWIAFKSSGKADKADRIKELEDAFTKHKVQELFRKGLVHDGFYGVGHIFIDLKGHEDAAQPVHLDPKSITKGSLRGFNNIEPMWVTPVMWNADDPTAADFYVPETWFAMSRNTHKTRLLQIISREVPDILKPAYNFGGISLSQLIEPYVDRWLKTVSGVNRLINNFSLIALKTDMSTVLSGGPDTDIRRRMKMARQHGDNMGMFLMDKNKEELEQIAVPLSGLSELQAQAQEHMAAPTHLPLVVLTGITPSGLNASSDGEIEVYHDWNRSEQNAVIRPPLTHVMHVVMLDLWGEIDKDITFDFTPIKQVTGEALARIKKTQAEQDQVYIDAGVVDRAEVREKVARDPDSGYTNLSAEQLPELPDGDGPVEVDPDEEGDRKPSQARDEYTFPVRKLIVRKRDANGRIPQPERITAEDEKFYMHVRLAAHNETFYDDAEMEGGRIRTVDPEGNYICNGCNKAIIESGKPPRCAKVYDPAKGPGPGNGLTISLAHGSCEIYEESAAGDFECDNPTLSPQEASYDETPNPGWGCHRCYSYELLKSPESQGREGWCWDIHGMPVKWNGCCKKNEPPEREVEPEGIGEAA